MKHLNNAASLLAAVPLLAGCTQPDQKKEIPYKPNIIWIVVEDMSEHWSCYGETTIQTPNIDKLAQEGELFGNAFVTSPVCSPARSTMITGMYQTTFGAHNHRSQRKDGKGGGNQAYYESYRLSEEVPYLHNLDKPEPN
ncbi:MAG: sulfatase-like hydrolase/transferase, partial [Bacteroidales bacterium]